MNVAEHWDQLLRDAAIVAEILPVDTALARGLGSYDHVIWATSTDTGDVITTAERDTITSYLNGGGRLLLISENAGEDEGDEAWFADAFAAEHGLDEMSGSSRVRLFGVEAGPFPEADIVLLGAEGAGNAQHQGSIAPLPAATPFFHYVSSEEIGGVGYQRDTGASAYLAFNLEAASGGDDSDPAPVILTTILTWLGDFSSQVPDGEASSARPSELHLAAHPNPFNSTVRLDFTLPTEGEVRLEVFDLLGRRVSLLLQERRGPGSHSASWSAEDLPSGICLARLAGPSGASSVRKLVLVR
jgi:hypothetical protein